MSAVPNVEEMSYLGTNTAGNQYFQKGDDVWVHWPVSGQTYRLTTLAVWEMRVRNGTIKLREEPDRCPLGCDAEEEHIPTAKLVPVDKKRITFAPELDLTCEVCQTEMTRYGNLTEEDKTARCDTCGALYVIQWPKVAVQVFRVEVEE